MTTDSAPSRAKGAKRAFRAGVVVIVASVAALLLAVLMLSVRAGPAFSQMMGAAGYRLPMDTTVTLDAGTWVVFERTGSHDEFGPLTRTTNRLRRLTPDQVSVTDAAGRQLPTSRPTTRQTLNRNGTLYTGAVTFDAPTDGRYHVTVSGSRGQVLIARDLAGLFVSSAGWLFLVLGAIVGGVAGIALVVAGRRRQRPGPDQGAGRPTWATAPPGWHPDPNRPGQLLWWDGSQWHLPADDGQGST